MPHTTFVPLFAIVLRRPPGTAPVEAQVSQNVANRTRADASSPHAQQSLVG